MKTTRTLSRILVVMLLAAGMLLAIGCEYPDITLDFKHKPKWLIKKLDKVSQVVEVRPAGERLT